MTEFLPISSSGHLMLISELFGIDSTLSFTVWLHVGTLIAVCVFYRKRILYLITHPSDKCFILLIIASVPTFIIAAAIKLFVHESVFRLLLPLGFFTTIILLLVVERFKGKLHASDMGCRRAIITGTTQGIAVFVGLSRSGATIFALTAQGVTRAESGEFSFLLSIPIIVAGGVAEGYSAIKAGAQSDGAITVIVGVAIAAIVGYFAIKLMLKLILNHSLKFFALYLLIPLLLSVLLY